MKRILLMMIAVSIVVFVYIYYGDDIINFIFERMQSENESTFNPHFLK